MDKNLFPSSPLSLFLSSLLSHLTLTLYHSAFEQLLEQAEIARVERMEAQRALKLRQEAIRKEEEEREDREESERMKMEEGTSPISSLLILHRLTFHFLFL